MINELERLHFELEKILRIRNMKEKLVSNIQHKTS